MPIFSECILKYFKIKSDLDLLQHHTMIGTEALLWECKVAQLLWENAVDPSNG